MTLIAHGILKLAAIIEDKRYGPYKTDAYYGKANTRFRELKRFEGAIGWVEGNPLALETGLATVAVGVPIIVVLAPIVGGVLGVKELLKIIEKKKAEEEKQKKAEKERLAKVQADLDLEKETSVLTGIIKEASLIASRDVKKGDINVFHAGLLNPDKPTEGKVIDIDKNHIAFIYDFGDKQEINVFFVNPETGNKEQIAQITSKDGIKAIELAISKRKAELKAKADEISKLRAKNAVVKENLTITK